MCLFPDFDCDGDPDCCCCLPLWCILGYCCCREFGDRRDRYNNGYGYPPGGAYMQPGGYPPATVYTTGPAYPGGAYMQSGGYPGGYCGQPGPVYSVPVNNRYF